MNSHSTVCLSLLLPLTLLGAPGCFSETRTYSMQVKNDLDTPVSVCVTKAHSPPELGWEAPEDLILPPHAPSEQKPPGMVIPPGKTLTAPPFKGKFDPDRGQAFLRVYMGEPSLTQMNAISVGSPDRLDVPLDPGHNRIIIKPAHDGGMTAVHVTGPWPATQPGNP